MKTVDEYASFVESKMDDLSHESGKKVYVARDGGYITLYCERTKLISKHGWYDMNRCLNEHWKEIVAAAKNSIPKKKDNIESAQISIDVPVVSCGSCGYQYILYVVLEKELVLNQVQSEYCPDCGIKRSWD